MLDRFFNAEGSQPPGSGTADIITGSAQAASMVAQTVANIIDQTKRRKFEQSLATLNQKQMMELNEKMLKARTETERLNILSNSLIQYAIENEKSAKNAKVMMLAISGALAITLLVIAYFALKTKK